MKITKYNFLLKLTSEWYDHFCKGALPVNGNTTFVKVHIHPFKAVSSKVF